MFTIRQRKWAFSICVGLLAVPLVGAIASPPYGDGTAGNLTVSVSGVLGINVANDSNFQFRNFTVELGVVLQVASGTVIRCRGKFTNLGTIIVQQGEHGGIANGGGRAPAGQGVGHRPAGYGAVGDDQSNTFGGVPAPGLSEAEARTLRHVGPSGGGGGGSTGIVGAGGLGGGSLTVLARKGITNIGMILADSMFPFGLNTPGDGGGPGGVIVLASSAFVINESLITARGSNGEDGSDFSVGYIAGGGGGGGGGIVHFLSPEIDAGKVNMNGGLGGAASLPSAAIQRSGGGSGGACGGDGGQGGSVPPGMTAAGAGQPGDPGYVLETKVDPSLLF